MLSSADLHLERALFLAVLILFFGTGFLCTLIALIINSIRKKNKSGRYYILLFLISGAIGVASAAFYFYVILFEQVGNDVF
ncbi:hypothetical protein [Chryseobacterium sp. ON_d1]|uniref:hypothetical protein n=1 Tax=Chryseobacterium sp. ON_d1 TaxID=2583211 RepID=UPI001158E9AB|nr:hypothetical protein [Chryseobacterium sp. ON_d1]GEJ47433.1 hypothetical protein CRS_40410 [Chryseobacterium sp. ON_d1]